mmetsp:Transcript_5736/g.12623  ORF Transcript_5736/g.12623 Transcript_5736/m.12623 type:complete len:202 (+) Transcript_5736:1021-1626(+)
MLSGITVVVQLLPLLVGPVAVMTVIQASSEHASLARSIRLSSLALLIAFLLRIRAVMIHTTIIDVSSTTFARSLLKRTVDIVTTPVQVNRIREETTFVVGEIDPLKANITSLDPTSSWKMSLSQFGLLVSLQIFAVVTGLPPGEISEIHDRSWGRLLGLELQWRERSLKRSSTPKLTWCCEAIRLGRRESLKRVRSAWSGK